MKRKSKKAPKFVSYYCRLAKRLATVLAEYDDRLPKHAVRRLLHHFLVDH